jgi:putative tricarboxylic transport membrane protein
MSEGVHASPDLSSGGKKIRNPRDFWGGVALVLLGLLALWASHDLPGMHGFAFGPGTAPRLFAIILVGLGIAVSAVGLLSDGPAIERYEISAPALICLSYFFAVSGQASGTKIAAGILALAGAVLGVIGLMSARRQLVRGPLFITISIIIFAVTVRPLGLVIASYLSIFSASAATKEVRWIEAVIWSAVLTAFCVFLFPIALNLPLQLWPTNLSWSSLLNFH